MKIKFVGIEELCKLLEENEEISFTFDSCEEDLWWGEPTGWYGMKIVRLFDNKRVVAGYYGGNDSASEGFRDQEEFYDAVRCVLETLCLYASKVSSVCVDLEEIEEKRVSW